MRFTVASGAKDAADVIVTLAMIADAGRVAKPIPKKSFEPQRHRGTEKTENRAKRARELLSALVGSVLLSAFVFSVPLWFKKSSGARLAEAVAHAAHRLDQVRRAQLLA